VNVRTDNAVCILLQFTHTNTETFDEVEGFDNCRRVVECSHARDRDATIRYTKFKKQNFVCQVLHKLQFVLPVLFELALKLSSHKFIFRTTATKTHFQNVTNYKSVSPQCSGLIEK
jgi:hypothetical protein